MSTDTIAPSRGPDASILWYRPESGFFDEHYFEEYPETAREAIAERQVDFAIRAAQLEQGAEVLDLGCGPGRHALVFAARGFAVTAQDIHPELLRIGSAEAARRGLEVQWTRADMRTIPAPRRYALIAMYFTAFGLLENDTEDEKVLAACRDAARPGGRLLIDVPNRDYLIRNFVSRAWFERADGTLVLDERSHDPVSGRIHHVRHRVSRCGERQVVTGAIRLYSPAELRHMLERAAFEVQGVYGDFDGRPLNENATRCIVLARRTDP